MARIFICYSDADVELARHVYARLATDGHDVFMHEQRRDGIRPGQEWKPALFERLRWTDVVACLVTEAFATSYWCFAEVAAAQTLGRLVIPVAVTPSVTHPLLDTLQYLTVRTDASDAFAALVTQLREVDAAGGTGWPDGLSPFPGLVAFDGRLQQAYFGRGDDIRALAGMLRAQVDQGIIALALVVGPSGCGKSSLVRAGLLPTMARDPDWWTLPPLTPAAQAGGVADPMAELAVSLATQARTLGLAWTLADVLARLSADHGFARLAEELLVSAPGWRSRLLLVVDQFEELITQTGPELRRQFACQLQDAMRGRVTVVATLRPEFLGALQTDKHLGDLPRQIIEIGPLRRDSLATVIEQPCRLAGIDVDQDLVSRMVGDTDTGEALPFLAFTLQQLALNVGRGGRLSALQYEQLGGVAGALVGQAERALAAARARTGRASTQVIAGLLRLATVDQEGRPIRRRIAVADLPEDLRVELAEFVNRRLLITDTDRGVAVITVSHEAFLTAWPRFAHAIAQHTAALRVLPQVEFAAQHWHHNSRPSRDLWEGNRLAGALADIGARPATPRITARRPRQTINATVELSANANAFLRASIRTQRRRQARATGVLAVLLVIALVGIGIAVIAQRKAQRQERIAVAHGLSARADRLRERDPRTALKLGIAAREIYDDEDTRTSLATTLTTTAIDASLAHPDQVFSVAWSPDGRTLATSARASPILLWNVTDAAHPKPLGQLDAQGAVTSMAWSPDGRILASGRDDGVVILWDASDSWQKRQLSNPRADDLLSPVWKVAWSPDGLTFTFIKGVGLYDVQGPDAPDTALFLWDVADLSHPRWIGSLRTEDAALAASVAWSADGRTLAVGRYDDSVILLDMTNRSQPRRLGDPLTGYTDQVTSMAWSPDGRTLATDGNDGTIIFWDVATPSRARHLGNPLTGHPEQVRSLKWSPNGRTLATTGFADTLMLWDMTDPALPNPIGSALVGHTDIVSEIAWSPDGRKLASGSADTTVIIWDATIHLAPTMRALTLPGTSSSSRSIAWSPTGAILAVGDDKLVKIWDLAETSRPRKMANLPPSDDGVLTSVRALAWAPNGHILATAKGDRVILWDLTNPTRPHRIDKIDKPVISQDDVYLSTIAWAFDGRTLATVAPSGISLWDMTNPNQAHSSERLLRSEPGYVAWSPNELLLATGSDKQTILWDVTDRSRPHRLDHPLDLHGPFNTTAWAPDGTVLATAGEDNTVILWDVTDPSRPRRIGDPLVGHKADVTSLAWSPDGNTLATGSNDTTVILWDLRNAAEPRRLIQPLTGHDNLVYSVAWSADGRTLASTGDAVIMWDVAGLGNLKYLDDRASLCLRAGGGLTIGEWITYMPTIPFETTCTSPR